MGTDNGMGDEGTIKISESLMKNTTLTKLCLSCVKEKGGQNIKQHQKQTVFFLICITGNQIDDSGAVKISESLMKNTTLTSLDLSGVTQE